MVGKPNWYITIAVNIDRTIAGNTTAINLRLITESTCSLMSDSIAYASRYSTPWNRIVERHATQGARRRVLNGRFPARHVLKADPGMGAASQIKPVKSKS
jgi:hypothetical protein